jgi:hypothetical protein
MGFYPIERNLTTNKENKECNNSPHNFLLEWNLMIRVLDFGENHHDRFDERKKPHC